MNHVLEIYSYVPLCSFLYLDIITGKSNAFDVLIVHLMPFKTFFPRIRENWLVFLPFRSLISNTGSASLVFLQAFGSKTKYVANQSATVIFFNSPNV